MLVLMSFGMSAQPLNNSVQPGYKGIWFTLGQESDYGYKYSGGLATYTVKHNPIAVYAPEVDQTFFVYGGTTGAGERHLLCMAGCFDHKTMKVRKPVCVYDKQDVNDPHDNPSLQIDKDGYLWVFVSGRATKRPGFIYRSDKPYDISSFSEVAQLEMTYPQPMYDPQKGFLLAFTKYSGKRQLYWAVSKDGTEWSESNHLANIKVPGDKYSGHYQVTGYDGKSKIVSAFNRHKNGNVDTRTNIYYLQTTDWGKTWTTADGKVVETPVTDLDSPCLILDAQSKGQNVYIKDVNFDPDGNAVILYVKSNGHQPGPDHGPREWWTAHWTGKEWKFNYITSSYHNYDSGSLWVDGRNWTVIGPTEAGPQLWGTGGEIAVWKSKNAGKKWKKTADLTSDSRYNHGYVRRPYNGQDPFYAFWCDGNPDRLTPSHLYMTDSKGKVYVFPYDMTQEWESVIPCNEAPAQKQTKSGRESMAELTARVFERARQQFVILDSKVPEGKAPQSFDGTEDKFSKLNSWTSGFFPGSLWYTYEYTRDEKMRALAEAHTSRLSGIVGMQTHHDIGFQVNSSFGNAYRITGDQKYLPVIRDAANKLATRFSPVVGCIKSWDNPKWDYPVIVDNMMNLELLLLGDELFGIDSLTNIAKTHANTTMKNHFRTDKSSYHLVGYNPVDGSVVVKQTVQGFSNESAWSRGQAWGLYGYTMMAARTGEHAYLEHAEKIAAFVIPLLVDDAVPYWDFNAPGTPNAFSAETDGHPEDYRWKEGDRIEKDASAGAVIASALVQLSQLTSDKKAAKTYLQTAERILRSLASDEYLAGVGENGGYLLRHSVTNLHANSGVDIPLTYADYYFLEALLRFGRL